MIDITKKYRTRDGRPVRVLCVDLKGEQPVVALIMCADGDESVLVFDADGKYLHKSREPANLDLIEISPYEDFKIDEPVMVRDTTDDHWQPRHFAGADERGRPLTWSDRGTSWSTNLCVEWSFCRRPTERELKK